MPRFRLLRVGQGSFQKKRANESRKDLPLVESSPLLTDSTSGERSVKSARELTVYQGTSQKKEATKWRNDRPVVESFPLLADSTSDETSVQSASLLTVGQGTVKDDQKNEGTTAARARLPLKRMSESFRRLSLHVSNAVAEHTGSIGYMGSYAIAVSVFLLLLKSERSVI